MQKNLITSVIIIVLVALGIGFLLMNAPEESVVPNIIQENTESTTLYKDELSGVSFYYPKSWGEVQASAGNTTCPEEDTYRTQDTLHLFDRELRFVDRDLPESDSFIRSGIRFYRYDPKKPADCFSQILARIAAKEMTGEEISSVKLDKANIEGFYGTHNERASRLDTEGREQYTLFKDHRDGSVLLIQPYMSFIPFADSPEWEEIDGKYPMDILSYINKGDTSGEIRKFREDFRNMAESIRLEE